MTEPFLLFDILLPIFIPGNITTLQKSATCLKRHATEMSKDESDNEFRQKIKSSEFVTYRGLHQHKFVWVSLTIATKRDSDFLRAHFSQPLALNSDDSVAEMATIIGSMYFYANKPNAPDTLKHTKHYIALGHLYRKANLQLLLLNSRIRELLTNHPNVNLLCFYSENC